MLKSDESIPDIVYVLGPAVQVLPPEIVHDSVAGYFFFSWTSYGSFLFA